MISRRFFPPRKQVRAFTLIELMIVMGIIALSLVLVTPAFNPIRSADRLTDAAYTVKSVLEQARTHAKTKSTYTWVGFFEEDGSIPSNSPATPGNGRLVMSIVASKTGELGFNPNASASPTNLLDIGMLEQVGKLVKIENVHVPLFAIGNGTGETFDTRPPLQSDPVVGSDNSRFGELNAGALSAPRTDTKFPFQYPVGSPTPPPQYTFKKTLLFNPRGEGVINSTYDVRRVVEIGLIPTRGNIAPVATNGQYVGNVIAIQITGFGGPVKLYRR